MKKSIELTLERMSHCSLLGYCTDGGRAFLCMDEVDEFVEGRPPKVWLHVSTEEVDGYRKVVVVSNKEKMPYLYSTLPLDVEEKRCYNPMYQALREWLKPFRIGWVNPKLLYFTINTIAP